MDTAYIYAASRVKALEAKLLNDNQLERLLGAEDTEAIKAVLHDTFLAGALTSGKYHNLQEAIEGDLVHTKKLLNSIAPNERVMDILWLRYDFLNLKNIIKGTKLSLSEEEILERCAYTSKYAPDKLLTHFTEGTLGKLDSRFAAIAELQGSDNQVYDIDVAANLAYLEAAATIAHESKDPFLTRYTTLLIDFFNLKSALRFLTLPNIPVQPFARGGSIQSPEKIDTKEAVLERLKQYGKESFWTEGAELYEETSDTSILERNMDDYKTASLKDEARVGFNLASLFGYFKARKNNLNIIHTIATAKENGLPEVELRKIQRKLYVNFT